MNIAEYALSRGGLFLKEPAEFPQVHISAFLLTLEESKRKIEKFAIDLNNQYRPRGCKGTNLNVGFTNSHQWQATAETIGEQDFILIDIGLCSTIWKILSIFANFDIYDAIHTGRFKSGGFSPKNPLNINVDFSDDMFGLSDPACNLIGRKLEFQKTVFYYCLLWIMHHEFAHIWFGHTTFIKSLNGYSKLSDYSKEDTEKFLNDTIYSLECHADLQAATGYITSLLPISLTENGLKFCPPHGIFTNILSIKILMMIFAQRFCCCFFDIMHLIKGTNISIDTHPRSIERRSKFRDEFRFLFEETEFIKYFNYADLFSGHMLLSGIFAGGWFSKRVSYFFEEKMEHEFDSKLLERWNLIYPDLSRHIRGQFLMGALTPGYQHQYISRDGKEVSRENYFSSFPEIITSEKLYKSNS